MLAGATTYIKRLFGLVLCALMLLAVSCNAPKTTRQKSKGWHKQRSAYFSKKDHRRMSGGKGFGRPTEKELSKAHKRTKYNSKKFYKKKGKFKKGKSRRRGM